VGIRYMPLHTTYLQPGRYTKKGARSSTKLGDVHDASCHTDHVIGHARIRSRRGADLTRESLNIECYIWG
jgi:hypothetical protein